VGKARSHLLKADKSEDPAKEIETIAPLVKTKSWQSALVPVVGFALVAASVLLGLRSLGYWQVSANPLAHAQAIVVLSGHLNHHSPLTIIQKESRKLGGIEPG